MTAPPFGFPGAPGGSAPGAMPGVPQQTQAPVAFVLNIPPDPTWEPFETTDTLAQDGYYCAQIIKESPRNDEKKSAGIFMTLQIFDEDAKGKILSRFLPDSKTTTKNTWFVWRGLLRSIYGGDAGKALQGFTYTPGALTGAFVYIKTAAYMDDGVMRTGVEAWSTKEEWEANRAKGAHRWTPRPPQQTGGGVGALPGGLPSSFPGGGSGLPGGGPTVPGAPSAFPPAATAPVAPQPGAAPMAATAPTSPFPPQQPTAPAMTAPPPVAGAPSPFPPQAPAAAAPAAPATPPPFNFAPTQPAAAPAAPPPNGAPQPTNAAGIMGNFPGAPAR